jgi:hypothetical protein
MLARTRIRHLTLTFAILAGGLAPVFGDSATLADFQAAAARHRLTLSLPDYPRTPDEIKQQTAAALAKADAALAQVAAEDPTKLTFARTFAAVDAIVARVGDVYQVTGTVAQSALDPAMRDTANEMSVKIQEWNVGLDYRADLYRTLKQVADSGQPLDREQQRLVDEQMRSYRRAGLGLPEKEREEVAEIFRGYGMPDADIAPVVAAISADRERWVDFMMRFELGLEEPDPKRARNSAVTIAVSYILGGLVPLAPYMLIGELYRALAWSMAVTLAALYVFGFVKGRLTGISPWRGGFQTTVIGGLASAAAFGLARLIG